MSVVVGGSFRREPFLFLGKYFTRFHGDFRQENGVKEESLSQSTAETFVGTTMERLAVPTSERLSVPTSENSCYQPDGSIHRQSDITDPAELAARAARAAQRMAGQQQHKIAAVVCQVQALMLPYMYHWFTHCCAAGLTAPGYASGSARSFDVHQVVSDRI